MGSILLRRGTGKLTTIPGRPQSAGLVRIQRIPRRKRILCSNLRSSSRRPTGRRRRCPIPRFSGMQVLPALRNRGRGSQRNFLLGRGFGPGHRASLSSTPQRPSAGGPEDKLHPQAQFIIPLNCFKLDLDRSRRGTGSQSADLSSQREVVESRPGSPVRSCRAETS